VTNWPKTECPLASGQRLETATDERGLEALHPQLGPRFSVNQMPRHLYGEKPFPTRTVAVTWFGSKNGVAHPMFADPLWLTALASLITSLSSIVWALRRKR